MQYAQYRADEGRTQSSASPLGSGPDLASYAASAAASNWGPDVQDYLATTLRYLAAGLLVCGVSSAVWPLGYLVAMIGSIAASVWLVFAKDKITPFFAATMAYGGALQPLLSLFADLGEERAVWDAVLLTALLTAAVSVCALSMSSRNTFVLASLVSVVGSALCWMMLIGLFTGFSRTMMNLDIYLGIVLYAGVLTLRVRSLAEQAAAGYRKDPIMAAFDLFRPIVQLFTRILIAQLNGKKKKR